VEVGEELITLEAHAYQATSGSFIVHLCAWCSGDPRPLAARCAGWSRSSWPTFPSPPPTSRIMAALFRARLGRKQR